MTSIDAPAVATRLSPIRAVTANERACTRNLQRNRVKTVPPEDKPWARSVGPGIPQRGHLSVTTSTDGRYAAYAESGIPPWRTRVSTRRGRRTTIRPDDRASGAHHVGHVRPTPSPTRHGRVPRRGVQRARGAGRRGGAGSRGVALGRRRRAPGRVHHRSHPVSRPRPAQPGRPLVGADVPRRARRGADAAQDRQADRAPARLQRPRPRGDPLPDRLRPRQAWRQLAGRQRPLARPRAL